MKERGIHIPLTYRSWQLIREALTYVVEKPHLDSLEESRPDIGRLLRHISKRIEEVETIR